MTSQQAAGYKRIALGKARPFEISGGLQEGYGDGPNHDIQEVIDIHHAWQRRWGRVLGIRVARCTLSYGWPASPFDPTTIFGASEPGFIVSGGINVLYDGETADATAWHRVISLAMALASKLNQTRIYVTWDGQDSIWERDDA